MDVQHTKAVLDSSEANDRAEWAEANAALAVDYAYAAVEEADYAVLDAIRKRREADEAAKATTR